MRKREKLVLGIETVTKIGSLAIIEDGKVLAQVTIDTQLRHNAKLISCLDDLLKGLSVDISKIDIIAVDIGPGSFTGIRVGLSTAFGLARADNKQLVGVCSLEVLYDKVKKNVPRNAGYFIIPAIDAKRGLYYSAIYGLDGKEIKKPYLVSKENLPQGFLFGPEIDNTYPDAGHVAMIGWEKIKEGFAAANAPGMPGDAGFSQSSTELRATSAVLARGSIPRTSVDPKDRTLMQKNIEPMYLHDIEYHSEAEVPPKAG